MDGASVRRSDGNKEEYGCCRRCRQNVHRGYPRAHIIIFTWMLMKRRNEIWSSITNNIAHKFVKKVHLMFEGGDAAQLPPLKENLKEKLVVVPVDAQPTYKRFFEYANRVLLRGTIAVVLNADIYIGEGFGCLRPPARNSSWDNGNGKIRRVAFALSRWPEKSCRRDALKCAPSNYETFTGHHGSHDAFVFAPPLPQAVLNGTDHVQNRFGAENVVVFELMAAGYYVTNPCRILKTYHRHCTVGTRAYAKTNKKRISGRRHSSAPPCWIKYHKNSRGVNGKCFVDWPHNLKKLKRLTPLVKTMSKKNWLYAPMVQCDHPGEMMPTTDVTINTYPLGQVLF